MKNIKGYLLISTMLFLAFTEGYTQEGTYVEVRDLETWTSAEFNLKVDKKWNFGLQSQMRLDNNSSERKSYLTQLSTDYKFTKKFQMGIGFRHTIKNDNEGNIQGNEHFFRFQVNASYKHKANRFDFKHRFRYTSSNEIGVSKIEGDLPEQYFRFKSSVGYNIKDWKLDPEFSGELFSKYIKYGQSNGLDRFRLTIGTSYKLKAIGKIGLYYRMEREINALYPKTTNILQFKYAYTLKR